MKAIIFGASGMVGTEVLSECLSNDYITTVVSVVRKASGIEHPKLTEIEHLDYTDYSALSMDLMDADVCYFCIGVYQNRVSKEMLWEITVDYVAALILKFEDLNLKVRFCLFSAQGADPRERTPMLFAKAKGRAERILFESKIGDSYAFRAGFINPVKKSGISGLALFFFRIVYKILPSVGINADDLGKTMVEVGIRGHEMKIFENRDLRTMIRPS